MSTRDPASKETREAIAGAVDLAAFVCGVLLPVVLGILIWRAPNPVTATAAAGRFVSSVGSAGGFFTPGVTTIHTTRGSIAVDSQFSALRGQQLTVERKFNGDTRLCVVATPRECAGLASGWPGALRPVPYQRPTFAWLVTNVGSVAVTTWIMLGLLGTFAAVGIGAVVTDAGTGSEQPGGDDDGRDSG